MCNQRLQKMDKKINHQFSSRVCRLTVSFLIRKEVVDNFFCDHIHKILIEVYPLPGKEIFSKLFPRREALLSKILYIWPQIRAIREPKSSEVSAEMKRMRTTKTFISVFCAWYNVCQDWKIQFSTLWTIRHKCSEHVPASSMWLFPKNIVYFLLFIPRSIVTIGCFGESTGRTSGGLPFRK